MFGLEFFQPPRTLAICTRGHGCKSSKSLDYFSTIDSRAEGRVSCTNTRFSFVFFLVFFFFFTVYSDFPRKTRTNYRYCYRRASSRTSELHENIIKVFINNEPLGIRNVSASHFKRKTSKFRTARSAIRSAVIQCEKQTKNVGKHFFFQVLASSRYYDFAINLFRERIKLVEMFRRCAPVFESASI